MGMVKAIAGTLVSFRGVSRHPTHTIDLGRFLRDRAAPPECRYRVEAEVGRDQRKPLSANIRTL
jgi:hypothetical protein